MNDSPVTSPLDRPNSAARTRATVSPIPVVAAGGVVAAGAAVAPAAGTAPGANM